MRWLFANFDNGDILGYRTVLCYTVLRTRQKKCNMKEKKRKRLSSDDISLDEWTVA